ncbi:MAG: helix-turn-helix transcriptional regulator [Hyphomicrobium sp.]|uniref:helix-turn-helix domain-containing protein n=1 Tax=Hyphomicrobium sp. TaxID=82 RepID=UPI003567ABAF
MPLKYKLKEARKMKGESLREASKGMGKSHEWLNKHENGKLKMDSELLIMFAKYYGVTVDYLMPNPNRPKIVLGEVEFHKYTKF